MRMDEYWAANYTESQSAWCVFNEAILDTGQRMGDVAPDWERSAFADTLGLPGSPAVGAGRDLVETCGPVGCGKDQIIALAAIAFVRFGPKGAKAVKQSTSKDKSKEVVDTVVGFIARGREAGFDIGRGLEVNRDEIRSVCLSCGGDRCFGRDKCSKGGEGSRLNRVVCTSLDGASAIGIRASLFLVNEVQDWNFRGEMVYDHMFSRFRKVGGRFVCFTNAPFTPRGEWRRDRWEEARREGSDWYFRQVKAEDCPWLTDILPIMRRNLATTKFRRLYMCEPTDGRGELVTKEEMQRCVFPELVEADSPRRPGRRFMGVDLGYARDHSVIVVMCVTPEGAVILERVDVWVPENGEHIQLEDVEERARVYLKRWKCKGFFDPYQAIEMTQRLKAEGLDVECVSSTAVNLTLMCASVRELVRDGKLRLYPDAGLTRVSESVETNLVQQLVDAKIKESERGEKIVSERTKLGHGDQLSAFALAAFGVTQAPKNTAAFGYSVSDEISGKTGIVDRLRRTCKDAAQRHRQNSRKREVA